MTKHLKRLRPLLLLTALLLLANCQEDLYDDIVTSENTSSQHRLITGQKALEEKKKLLEVLKTNGGEGVMNLKRSFSSTTTSRYTMQDVEDYIDQSEVYEVADKFGNFNYTMRVNHPDVTENSFFNIVRKSRNGKSKVMLIEYEMEPKFASFYFDTGKLEEFTGTIRITKLAAHADVDCPYEPEPPIPIQGGHGPGHDGGGGGGGGGDYPVTYNPHSTVHPMLQLVAIQHAFLDFITAPRPVPEDDWEEVSQSPRYMGMRIPPRSLTDGTGPCDSGQEIGILDPYEARNHSKNCEKLKNLTDNPVVKTSLNALKGKINQHTESAFTFSLNGSGQTLAAPETGHTGNSANIKVTLATYGVAHTHQSGPNNNSGLFKMFSFADISSIYKIAKGYGGSLPNPPVPPMHFNMMVIDGYTYAVFPNDVEAFKAMSNIFENNNKLTILNRRLEDLYNNIAKNEANGNPNNVSHESLARYFLMFMSNNNTNGIANGTTSGTDFNLSLYRIDNTAGHNGLWEKLELDPNRYYQLKTSKPCN